MDDITKKKVFGTVTAFMYVIEFQKRRLPHAHILIHLKKEDKPLTADHLNRLICAEIPDKEQNPRLHEIVMRSMIHGPCDQDERSPCLENGVCSKKFPKRRRQ